MASSTYPHPFFVYDFVIEYVVGAILPISKSYKLFRFGLLRANACVLVLPHATVSVIGMIWASVNFATRDPLPAALGANEVPYRSVIDGTAY